MKNTFVFLLILSSAFSFGESMRPDLPLYTIVSDVTDTTIKRGYCVIEGTVIDQVGTVVSNAMISSMNKRNKVYTNAEGKFEIAVPSLDTAIFMFHETYGEIVLSDYDFKSKHRIVVRFSPRAPYHEEQKLKKPVIYLYAGQPTKVTVELEHPGITFTYPAYDQNWTVTTAENGMLTDNKTGHSYPYLFWEGTTTNLTYSVGEYGVEGFLISTDSIVLFFENSLAQLGLNETEQADFITFWAPQLNQTPYVFIQFLVDDLYGEKIASLNVSPLPDSQRRVFMLYAPLQTISEMTTEIVPQKLTSFTREGLTLVEWGGAMLNQNALLPDL